MEESYGDMKIAEHLRRQPEKAIECARHAIELAQQSPTQQNATTSSEIFIAKILKEQGTFRPKLCEL